MEAPRNLAARAAGWSTAHWKTATGGWLAFVVVAIALGSLAGTHQLAQSDSQAGEAGRAAKALGRGFPQPASETVLIRSATHAASEASFRAVVRDVVRSVSAAPSVTAVRSPVADRNAGQISRNGHAAIVQFELAGDSKTAGKRVEPVLRSVAAAQARHPSYLIRQAGDASADRALSQMLGNDFKRAERLALPITLLIMLFAFGALVAAGIPVLLAFSGVLSAIGISALVSHLLPAADATQSVILLVGMAVGVDYSLFYLKREREERARGLDAEQALARAATTSGEAVLISGATVLAAVSGMLLSGDPAFRSFGVGMMIVVACAVVGSVTVLPAVLHKLGDRVEKGRIPLLSRLRGEIGRESRIWGAVLDVVLRRPAIAVVLAGGLLVAAAVPTLGIQTKFLSINDLPRSIPIVKTVRQLNRDFPGATVPAVVVVQAANVDAPAIRRGIRRLRAAAVATGQLTQPIEVAENPAHTIARVTVPIRSADSRSAAAYAALDTLRTRVIPETIGRVPGTTVGVTGETAGNRDFNTLLKVRLPLVFVFVLGLAFLLLLATFRSLVVPLVSIVLNLLSVGASYGILVLVFQHRWAEGILGFRSNGGIASWIPLFLFVLLFGLSTDYHVFVVSRVRELVRGGASTRDAVSRGVRQTAGTVSAAAIVMVAVFSVFATLSELDLKQAGFGLAVAILIDATIIRGVLLPAAMTLLGEWNWYLPRRLAWLPGARAPEQPEPLPLPVPASVPRS